MTDLYEKKNEPRETLTLTNTYLYTNEEEKHEDGYLTDLISNKAVDFVNRMAPGAAQGSPFFLSLHYTAPHWPWETREDHALAQEVKDNLFHLHGGNIHTYHRMIHHMDEGIGWVVDALKKTGQLDNTVGCLCGNFFLG